MRRAGKQAIGYGPVCYKTVFGTSIKKKKDKVETSDCSDFPYYEIPGQMSIEDYLGNNSE